VSPLRALADALLLALVALGVGIAFWVIAAYCGELLDHWREGRS